jgi:hypothetical protein
MNGSTNEISNSSDTALICWLEHNELGRMWKDAAMSKYELLSQDLYRGAEEKPETL